MSKKNALVIVQLTTKMGWTKAEITKVKGKLG